MVVWIVLCLIGVVCIAAFFLTAPKRRRLRQGAGQSPDAWRVARDAAGAEAANRSKGYSRDVWGPLGLERVGAHAGLQRLR